VDILAGVLLTSQGSRRSKDFGFYNNKQKNKKRRGTEEDDSLIFLDFQIII